MPRDDPLSALRRCVFREVCRLVRRPRERRSTVRGGRWSRCRLPPRAPGPLDAAAHGGRVGRRARTPFTLYYRDDCGCFWVQFRVKGRRQRKSTEEGDRGAAESRAAAIWQEA